MPRSKSSPTTLLPDALSSFRAAFQRAAILPNGGLNLYVTIGPEDRDAALPITMTKGTMLRFDVREEDDEEIGEDLRELLGME